MRRRATTIGIGVAVAALVGAASVALFGHAVVLRGSAIEDGMAGTSISAPIVLGGRAYVRLPLLHNTSHFPLTIRAARPIGDPAGVRFVGLQIYDIADFEGSSLGGWSSTEVGAMRKYDPAKKRSKPLVGLTIPPKKAAGARPQNFVLMELETTELGVWRWPGTEIEYEQNGILFKQGIGPKHTLEIARDQAELERLYGNK